MAFWIAALLVALAVAAALAAPLLRRGGAAGRVAPDVAVYRDQLDEIARDLARGTLDPAEAERTRTEVARRLLAADRAARTAAAEAPPRASRLLTAGVVAVLLAGGLLTYARLGAPGYPDLPLARRLAEGDAYRASRISQAEAEAEAAATQVRPEVEPGYAAMVAELAETVAGRPDDLTGWMLLSEHAMRIGDYAGAARAQERVIALKGESAGTADLLALADRLVAAAAGFVSPETEALLDRILSVEPQNPGALYYVGLLYAQTDRPDIAFRLWRGLVEGTGAGPYGELARGLIGDIAFRAGVDYAPPERRGPTAADIAAAAEMDPEAQADMIRGMVAQLSERLAAEGGPAEDWAMLIGSLGVLGEADRARAIWEEAQAVFAADPAGLAAIRTAAAGAGVAE